MQTGRRIINCEQEKAQMKFWKFLLQLACIVCLSSLLLAPKLIALQLTDNSISATSKQEVPKPPEHPVTEDELRTFFAVCHTGTFNRAFVHEKLEAQRKQLPAWYPQPVWDEIEKAIDNIDLVQVALPVYRKYLSEDDVQWLSKFLATQQGQQMVMDSNEAAIRSLHSGANPEQAHQEALAYLAHEDQTRLNQLVGHLSPSEKQDLLKHGERFKALQPTIHLISQEYGQDLKNKQTDMAHSIALSHQAELTEAKKKYEANTPQ